MLHPDVKEFAVVSVHLSPADIASSAAGHPDAIQENRGFPQESNGLYCASEVRILVLDDDQSICRMIQAAIGSSAFKVDAVFDTTQIQEILHTQVYQVIILDYVLPGSGVRTSPRMDPRAPARRQHHRGDGLPLHRQRLSCLRPRTYDYLTKPFQIAQLQRS